MDKGQIPYISIVIPAYNEEKRLSDTLRRITAYMDKEKYSYELIVVDDGSTDGTIKILSGIKEKTRNLKIISNGTNQGKGASVRTGVLQSKGEYILFSDSDLSTPIEEMESFVKHLEQGYDIVIGSRSMKNSNILIHQPFYRELMGKIFNRIVNTVVFKGIIDTQCGFKMFKRLPAIELFSSQKINGYAFDVEVLYNAIRKKYKIKELPVKWINSPASKVNPVTSSIQMLYDILRIKFK